MSSVNSHLPLDFPHFLWNPMFLSEICWSSGVPIEGEQKGENQPFSGWKG